MESISRFQIRNRRFISRKIKAFDGKINLSTNIRSIQAHLKRSIIILDSCLVGGNAKSFYRASKAAGVVGFSEKVDWIDSTVFILALLLRYRNDKVMELERINRTTAKRVSRPQKVLEEMTNGPYKSLAKSLGVESYFGP